MTGLTGLIPRIPRVWDEMEILRWWWVFRGLGTEWGVVFWEVRDLFFLVFAWQLLTNVLCYIDKCGGFDFFRWIFYLYLGKWANLIQFNQYIVNWAGSSHQFSVKDVSLMSLITIVLESNLCQKCQKCQRAAAANCVHKLFTEESQFSKKKLCTSQRGAEFHPSNRCFPAWTKRGQVVGLTTFI